MQIPETLPASRLPATLGVAHDEVCLGVGLVVVVGLSSCAITLVMRSGNTRFRAACQAVPRILLASSNRLNIRACPVKIFYPVCVPRRLSTIFNCILSGRLWPRPCQNVRRYLSAKKSTHQDSLCWVRSPSGGVK